MSSDEVLVGMRTNAMVCSREIRESEGDVLLFKFNVKKRMK